MRHTLSGRYLVVVTIALLPLASDIGRVLPSLEPDHTGDGLIVSAPNTPKPEFWGRRLLITASPIAVSTLAAPSSSAAFIPLLVGGATAIEALEAVCLMYSLKGVAELGVEFFASRGGGIGAKFPKQDTVVRVLAHEPRKTALAAEEVVEFSVFAEEMAKKGMSLEEARKLFLAGKATEEGLIMGARLQKMGGETVWKAGKNLNKMVVIPGIGTLLKCADLVMDAGKFILTTVTAR